MSNNRFLPLMNQSKFEVSKWVNQVLIIINLRLGVEYIEAMFVPLIKKYMKMKQFVGMIGGLPRKAFFFMGCTEAPSLSPEQE